MTAKNANLTNRDVAQIFYSVFSGGDDLFIVGPWDWTLELARELRAAFKSFTAYNPNLTISGGLFLAKAKYPIHLTALESESALKQAKDEGRNRLSAFGEVAVWDEEDSESLVFMNEWKVAYAGFTDQELRRPQKFALKNAFDSRTLTLKELLEWAEKLEKWHKEENKLPRRFLHQLLRARRNYVFLDQKTGETKVNLMVFPKLIYLIERNLADSVVRQGLKADLITSGQCLSYLRQVRLPVSFVLTRSRRIER
jgi:CRISPR-associated protein Csm1